MAEALDAKSRVSRSESAVAGELIGETVLLDAGSDRYARLNRTGAWIWERLAEPATIAELTTAVASQFEISEARAAGDVTAFVEDLRERGLVEVG